MRLCQSSQKVSQSLKNKRKRKKNTIINNTPIIKCTGINFKIEKIFLKLPFLFFFANIEKFNQRHHYVPSLLIKKLKCTKRWIKWIFFLLSRAHALSGPYAHSSLRLPGVLTSFRQRSSKSRLVSILDLQPSLSKIAQCACAEWLIDCIFELSLVCTL